MIAMRAAPRDVRFRVPQERVDHDCIRPAAFIAGVADRPVQIVAAGCRALRQWAEYSQHPNKVLQGFPCFCAPSSDARFTGRPALSKYPAKRFLNVTDVASTGEQASLASPIRSLP